MFSGGFPGFRFGGFGGDDDMPGNDSAPQQDTDTNKLYELLGVEKNASSDEIKKSFRKKAIKLHPDKGGDPQKFAEINEAYEVLSNPEKRELYDKYGLEGVKNGGAPGMGGFGDIFDLFGGGMRGQGAGSKQQRKVKPTLKEIEVKLEDIYQGKMLNIPVERRRCCETCEGKGGSKVNTCTTCKGQGMVTKLQQFGPGMYQQSTQPCHDCKGQGKTIDEKDKCKSCKGQKIVSQKKQMELAVEQGVPDGHDYVLYGEGDEIPGAMAGDLVFRIKSEKHSIYSRKGADLFHEKKITLLEALTGFNFELQYLDNHKITISTMPGEVISHDEFKVVKGKGMPFYKDAMAHGNLYIKFIVEFPKRGQLKGNQIEELKKILPGPKTGPSDNKKAHFLEDFDETEMNTNAEGGKHRGGDEDEDDEDMPRGGQRVQCAQQ